MSNELMSLIGMAIAIGILMYLAFRGVSILILAPACAAFACIISGVSLSEGLVDAYSAGMGDFVARQFLVFTFGGIFGKLLGDSGAARVIALNIAKIIDKFPENKRKFGVVISMVIVCFVLTMGGVNAYVLIFLSVALSKELFEKYDVNWGLFSCLQLGSSSVTMTVIPGSPSIQNLTPTSYLGTTAMAAPQIGFTCAVIQTCLGVLYIYHAVKRDEKKHLTFMTYGSEIKKTVFELGELPHYSVWYCLIPPVAVLLLLNIAQLPAYICLVCGILLCCIMFRQSLTAPNKSLKDGATNAIVSLLNTAAITAFGTAITVLPGYAYVISAIDHLPGPPIVQIAVVSNIMACMAGSATGGLGLVMQNFAQKWMHMGINPEVIHRISTISCSGLDSLPHNGGLITNLSVTKLTHRQTYWNYFVLTVILPLISCVIACVMATLGFV